MPNRVVAKFCPDVQRSMRQMVSNEAVAPNAALSPNGRAAADLDATCSPRLDGQGRSTAVAASPANNRTATQTVFLHAVLRMAV